MYIYTCCAGLPTQSGRCSSYSGEGPIVSDTQIKLPTLEEIELRAYEIYLKRGDAEGIAMEDWLAAEKELLASRQADAVGPLMKRGAAS